MCSCACRSRSRMCFASGSRASSRTAPDRVINLLRSMHGGKDYVAEFGVRQKGRGPYADQIALRFRLAIEAARPQPAPPRASASTSSRPPVRKGGQDVVAVGCRGRAGEGRIKIFEEGFGAGF